jgi:hypothetical protein
MAMVRLVSFQGVAGGLSRVLRRFGLDLAMSARMSGNVNSMRWSDRFAIAGLVALSLSASGCGGGSLFGGPAATAPPPATAAPASAGGSGSSGTSYLTNFFSGSSDKGAQAVAGATPDVACPFIDIREGASTLTINAGGDDASGANTAMSLKYQGTFIRAARQCAVTGSEMTIKVGVEGRIILGPAGGPGQVDVPLRIAVVDESPEGSKPIVTKLIHIPVMVQSASDNPAFAYVEEGLTFPLPASSNALARYIVYIGFDPLAVQPVKKPPPKPKHKPSASKSVSGAG